MLTAELLRINSNYREASLTISVSKGLQFNLKLPFQTNYGFCYINKTLLWLKLRQQVDPFTPSWFPAHRW